MKKQLLIVDGYNMIGAWEETHHFFQTNQLAEARDILLKKLSEYASFEGVEVICVFDAQFVPGVTHKFTLDKVLVVFTKEDETADSYIEKLAGKCKNALTTVYVATSDLAEQWVVFSQGAMRVPARELEERVNLRKQALTQHTKQLAYQKPRTSWADDQLLELKKLLCEID
ncbi:MAG: NYN domain-containing protein [Streptococcaceae bacterium]|nr:NYN domain-containing protein [Streptococcaceae bacterium]